MVELERKSASRLTVDRYGARLDGVNVFAERSARQLVDLLHMNWLLLLLSPVIAALVLAIKLREEEPASPKGIRGMLLGGILGHARVA